MADKKFVLSANLEEERVGMQLMAIKSSLHQVCVLALLLLSLSLIYCCLLLDLKRKRLKRSSVDSLLFLSSLVFVNLMFEAVTHVALVLSLDFIP